jgi:3-hydroxybutyryl-CoA dehydrogenase
MDIKQVGVVGCGIMGGGIVRVCAQSGYSVIVSESNRTLLDKGLVNINNRLNKDVEKGKITEPIKIDIVSHIKGTTDISDFSSCDLVVEAVIENMDLKKKVFADLDRICPRHVILATNTSVMSIIELGADTHRPEKVLGLHFFNPPHVMQLLEIVRTIDTSEETIETGKEFGKSLGKTVVVVKDTPGFVVNRLSIAFTLNAIRMLESGIASRDDIDNAVKLGLNHPMGPFTLADMAGIDTLYFISCDLYDKLKDPAYAPPILLQKMFAAGRFGVKTGKGFYDYTK